MAVFLHATAKEPADVIDLDEYHRRVTSGELADAQAEYRARLEADGPDAAKAWRGGHCPLVATAGMLAARGAEHHTVHSGLVEVDLDHVTGPPATVRDAAADWPHVVHAAVSIGGGGVVALVRVDPPPADGEEHRNAHASAWTAITQHLQRLGYDHDGDTHGNSLDALRFMPHDPDARHLPFAPAFSWQDQREPARAAPPAADAPEVDDEHPGAARGARRHLRTVRDAPDGERHNALRAAAWYVAGKAKAGLLDWDRWRAAFADASALPAGERDGLLDSAWERQAAQPMGARGDTTAATAARADKEEREREAAAALGIEDLCDELGVADLQLVEIVGGIDARYQIEATRADGARVRGGDLTANDLAACGLPVRGALLTATASLHRLTGAKLSRILELTWPARVVVPHFGEAAAIEHWAAHMSVRDDRDVATSRLRSQLHDVGLDVAPRHIATVLHRAGWERSEGSRWLPPEGLKPCPGGTGCPIYEQDVHYAGAAVVREAAGVAAQAEEMSLLAEIDHLERRYLDSGMPLYGLASYFENAADIHAQLEARTAQSPPPEPSSTAPPKYRRRLPAGVPAHADPVYDPKRPGYRIGYLWRSENSEYHARCDTADCVREFRGWRLDETRAQLEGHAPVHKRDRRPVQERRQDKRPKEANT